MVRSDFRETLTVKRVERAKAPREGRTEILDTEVPQMSLRVTSTGHKSYSVRTRINGVQVRKILPHDASDLSEARDLARDVLRYAKVGRDIIEERRKEAEAAEEAKTAAQRLEWTKVREQFVDDYAKPNQRQWKETNRILKNYVDPEWKGKLLTNIERDAVMDLIQKVKKRHGLYMANRVLAHVRKLFNWAALQPRMLKATPIVRGMAQKGEKARERVLSDGELRMIWNAADTLRRRTCHQGSRQTNYRRQSPRLAGLRSCHRRCQTPGFRRPKARPFCLFSWCPPPCIATQTRDSALNV